MGGPDRPRPKVGLKSDSQSSDGIPTDPYPVQSHGGSRARLPLSLRKDLTCEGTNDVGNRSKVSRLFQLRLVNGYRTTKAPPLLRVSNTLRETTVGRDRSSCRERPLVLRRGLGVFQSNTGNTGKTRDDQQPLDLTQGPSRRGSTSDQRET